MSDVIKKYPISEIFTSIQGEGRWAGTVMTFIRFAGCCVGKKFTDEEKEQQPHLYLLPVYMEKCTTWDGRSFECDTDYRTKEVLTVKQIVDRIPQNVGRVCITGGEPLIHDMTPLFLALLSQGKNIHIETSGTRHIREAFPQFTDFRFKFWVAVSPKFTCLDSMAHLADEVKFLVDKDFDYQKAMYLFARKDNWPDIYLQPVNFENTVNNDNLALVKDLVNKYPYLKVSIQLHKILGVR